MGGGAYFQGFDVNWGFALFLSPVVTVKLITNSINSNSNKSERDRIREMGLLERGIVT